jgi:GNAT superfamily N-acetyltransferase
MGKQAPSGWGRIGEVMRWRGPFILSLLAVREFLRPVAYWHVFYVFERDVARQPPPEPYWKEKKENIEVRVYTREKDVDKAKTEMAGMGELAPDEIDARLNRGDAVAIAYAAGEPVGYRWLSFSSGVVELAFGITWIVRAHEAVRYGNFVLPNWRGRGIQSFVNAAVNVYARDLGIARTLASISTLNTQSMSLAKHYRTATAMKVVLMHIRGLNWTIHRASDAPFESRFTKPV